MMTHHVQFLLLVRQPLFDRAALPLTQTSWVLPPLSVGKMTLRLYSALNYSHGLSKGPSFGTGRDSGEDSGPLPKQTIARLSNTGRPALLVCPRGNQPAGHVGEHVPHDGQYGNGLTEVLRIDLVERVSVRMMQVQVEVVHVSSSQPGNAILHERADVRSPSSALNLAGVDTVQ